MNNMQNNPPNLADIDTPAAVVSLPRMQRNIARMQQQADALGVRFRPHVKTSKCADVVAAQLAAGAAGITVSTLKEADQFFARGVTDILYAVGMAPHRLAHALDLRQRGCALQILTDSVEGARAIAEYGRAHGHAFEVLIEIDTDGHRSGIKPGETCCSRSAACCSRAACAWPACSRMRAPATNCTRPRPWPPWPSRNARAACRLRSACAQQACRAPSCR